MNLILLDANDFLPGGNRVRLDGRRARQVREVHRAAVGAERAVGMLGGTLGRGTVVLVSADAVEMEIVLDTPPPPPLAITVVLALPRPKVLRRVLQGVTAMGVKRLYLVNAWRVEKSYWASPLLERESIQEDLRLGLEQGRDTILPEVRLRRLLRPFVEDELGEIARGTLALVGDGGSARPCPSAIAGPITLAIGPEGGFNPFEIELLQTIGFAPVALGPRALRVEHAVPALLGRLAEFGRVGPV